MHVKVYQLSKKLKSVHKIRHVMTPSSGTANSWEADAPFVRKTHLHSVLRWRKKSTYKATKPHKTHYGASVFLKQSRSDCGIVHGGPIIGLGLQDWHRREHNITMVHKEIRGRGLYSRYGEYDTGWTVRGSNPDNDKWFVSSEKHGAPQFSGYHGSFLGVKRPGRDVDHSPPSSAELKNIWSYTSIPLLRLSAFVAYTGKNVPQKNKTRGYGFD